MEEIWNFGYRCTVTRSDFYWHGTVYAPRWHPVRSEGMDNLLVLMINGEWSILKDFDDRQNALYWMWDTADILKVMQDEWDSLSPYEREYLVW